MRQKRKRERDNKLMECILNNKQTSPTLKKLIEENKEENLRKALRPKDHKLEISDRVIIRNCRKELYDKRREIREQWRKKQEQEQREPQNNNI